jgi:hypothetical protein
MTPFTLVMAYYDNPDMLRRQFEVWHALPPAVRQHLHVRIVDDGSPRWPAESVCTTVAGLASFQLWRMGVDVRWNQDACRNVGVREAATPWVLLTDMDHIVPVETWARLMVDRIDKGVVYRFGRVTAPAMTHYKHHPNSWAMRAKTYWKIGGYDEALAGNYGTDGDFLVRTRQCAPIVDLREVLIRVPREVCPDASTTTLERKSDADKARIRDLIAARRTKAGWRPLHFSFPCERVR